MNTNPMPQKGQRWRLRSGYEVVLRSVTDSIVIFPEPTDPEASQWSFIHEFRAKATYLGEDVKP